ncbi:dihydrolipoyl dehydrogenase family protein [Pseudodesulfovibrio piezophilus]|uniref:tRNA uridine 5-carboxymethylaminomethyl modification enzyme GidA n=1 Tax=Pseudodesulfovibrio piezophilus (strain DSM 21447 / JCM 15486 / C1TLV30) TaxID=1322246 RepID=M1WNB7_PSEP2|nr:FAD-dependent oxidoreductase [Pseudodesulfovibrio piezophilus]CCH47469.1 tRNA uridine 5-carboxymethylaminomethyl modification enzyme GidA [Pseudodesulfovibrio piezophilus C1TLV30]
MARYDFDIGILGGGAAGLTVASGAAQLGMKVLLLEKEMLLGGDCLHYGCVPSKTLIKTASVYHEMRRASDFGLPSFNLPPVDFRQVGSRIQSVIDAIQVHDSVDRFCQLGVQVDFGQASFVDSHTVEYGPKRVSAQFWVIATGSHSSIPVIPGLDGVDFLTNRDLFSLEALPKSLIIIGAGPIGCEMAQAFSRLGTDVTVLQRNCQVLSLEDGDMASVVQTTLQSEGVTVHLCAQTIKVSDKNNSIVVRYEIDGAEYSLEAEKLLVATGRSPSIEGLHLENAGVESDHKGVLVDHRLRTTQKHIFAAGDVTGRYQFTHAAGYEGGIVVSNVAFRLPRKVDYTWLPWCTYTEPELASIGLNEKAAKQAGREYSVLEESFTENDRAQAEGASVGRIKILLTKKGKPLGVQIVGPHAGEVLSEWVAILNGKTGLSTLASAIHPYPTVSEINKRVAGSILSQKIFSEPVRKTLRFFFGYQGKACKLD